MTWHRARVSEGGGSDRPGGHRRNVGGLLEVGGREKERGRKGEGEEKRERGNEKEEESKRRRERGCFVNGDTNGASFVEQV